MNDILFGLAMFVGFCVVMPVLMVLTGKWIDWLLDFFER